MNLLNLFCPVDDFCHLFTPKWEAMMISQGQQRRRAGQLSLSEVMTILIHFHQTDYRTFKAYYTQYVQRHLQSEFPNLVSYPRFVALMPRALMPMLAFLHSRYGCCSGISFIDSTSLAVCHNRRIGRHKVHDGVAQRGKTSMGWFYGYKLHIVVNERGELLACQLTSGQVDDRKPVPALARSLWGKLFADRGYLSKSLFDELWQQDLQLITKLRKNMKNRLMLMSEKLLLRKRAIIETIFDQLKNISQIEHTRHRSVPNSFVNVLSGLVAYTFQQKKPSLHFDNRDLASLIHN